jgi:hypothetical protein
MGQVTWFELLAATYGVDRDRVVGFALEQLGKPYAHLWQFFESFANPIFRAEDLSRGRRYFCSYLAQAALLAGGWQPWEHGYGQRPVSRDPGDVADQPCLHHRDLLEV